MSTLASMFISWSSVIVAPNVSISWAKRPSLALKGGHMLPPEDINSEWLRFLCDKYDNLYFHFGIENEIWICKFIKIFCFIHNIFSIGSFLL